MSVCQLVSRSACPIVDHQGLGEPPQASSQGGAVSEAWQSRREGRVVTMMVGGFGLTLPASQNTIVLPNVSS